MLLAIAAGVMLAAPVHAQSSVLQPGQRLRIWVDGCRDRTTWDCHPRYVGWVVSVWEDSVSLALEPSLSPIVIPFDEVERLETHRTRTGGFGRGALIGAVIGGVGAGLVGAMTIEDPGPCGFGAVCFSRGTLVALTALGGLFWGGLTGGVVGAVASRDTWLPVRVGQIGSVGRPGSRRWVVMIGFGF